MESFEYLMENIENTINNIKNEEAILKGRMMLIYATFYNRPHKLKPFLLLYMLNHTYNNTH